MPKVTINDRTVEVEAGTTLVDAALKVGVQIPHYCYHPRLSVVGQCRMCLVKIEGMPKLQAGCSTTVVKDGMVVRTDVPEVEEAQKGMMEFFLINHPLDCPICDQAGECGLQDYSFKHGVAYSRFRYEDKRTYPGRERIPLGANVILNMNRCIQCTRCVRFTQEIAKTGELGFFNRGARTEIGTFPGKELSNPLATCVVDICPVGALTSTRFRFAERVWYLDKRPSVCTGCEVGCNITMEHRRGDIKRYKPRYNPDVNDYWMCDYGRATFERYKQIPRMQAVRVKASAAGVAGNGNYIAAGWKEALDAVHRQLTMADGPVAFLGSPYLTTEEAWLFSQLADAVGSPHRSVPVDIGPERTIPNLKGGITGREAAPNRRGAELAGLTPGTGGDLDADELILGDGAARCSVLVVCDSDFSATAYAPETVEKLRRAKTLIVFGWADSPLAKVADIALPLAHHAEKDGTFVNVEWRLQKVERAFPAPGQVRPGVDVLAELLSRFDAHWAKVTIPAAFDRMAAALPAMAGLNWESLPATGAPLNVPQARPATSATSAEAANQEAGIG
ncbi:MAG TPA: 2Fe-2S iron-sulfur cluster-binding protein [Thermoanaerobaculia bacterium]|nr:2Fe-2S iron-sulfur cluster-binding protein [Thermoanaerobaculia bacterium]